MLLVYLDFNLNLGASVIGLIPDFAGYLVMREGLAELTGFSGSFSKVMPYVKGMAVYSGICYVIDVFGGASAMEGPHMLVPALIATVVSLFISYHIIMGIQEIESTREQRLNSHRLYSTWRFLAVASLVSLFFVYLIPTLAMIAVIAGFVASIYYLFIFHETEVLFYEQNPAE